MHIPDGFLSARVALGCAVTAATGLGLSCARLRGESGSKRALLGVSAAFVFAAQLVNFPIAAGTSGHLVGSALCTALLGLPGAVVALGAVLIAQCLMFGDGGVLALGANISNMALVGSVVSFALYRLGAGASPSPRRRVAAIAFAAWCATLASSAACAEELALSGAAPIGTVLPALLGVHALIGLGEAVITALVVSSILRLRPELIERRAPANFGRSAAFSGLSLALVVALLLAPFASAAPDGLTRVAGELGLRSVTGASFAPLAGYRVPGLGSGPLASLLAFVGGTLLMFGACWLLALVLAPRAATREPLIAESSG